MGKTYLLWSCAMAGFLQMGMWGADHIPKPSIAQNRAFLEEHGMTWYDFANCYKNLGQFTVAPFIGSKLRHVPKEIVYYQAKDTDQFSPGTIIDDTGYQPGKNRSIRLLEKARLGLFWNHYLVRVIQQSDRTRKHIDAIVDLDTFKKTVSHTRSRGLSGGGTLYSYDDGEGAGQLATFLEQDSRNNTMTTTRSLTTLGKVTLLGTVLTGVEGLAWWLKRRAAGIIER